MHQVLARGNRRATIFHDDANYRAYLERLERYRQRDGVMLHAYVNSSIVRPISQLNTGGGRRRAIHPLPPLALDTDLPGIEPATSVLHTGRRLQFLTSGPLIFRQRMFAAGVFKLHRLPTAGHEDQRAENRDTLP